MNQNICDNDVLCSYEGGKATDEYIKKLEKRKINSQSEKQLNVINKAAKELRTAVVRPTISTKNLPSVSQQRGNGIEDKLNFKSRIINFAQHNKVGNWFLRFIKYNLVGTITFLVGTVIFWLAFSTFGAWTWFVANCLGGVLEFSLIDHVNKIRNGRMF